jgi:hypothetical protein
MLNKVCFEREVYRRAQEPFEGRRRAETLRRLSKSKISEEIMLVEMQDKTQEIGLTGGAKAKAFEHLQTLPSRKKSKSQEEETTTIGSIVGRNMDR